MSDGKSDDFFKMQLGEEQNQRHTVTSVILAAFTHPGIPGGSFSLASVSVSL